MSKLLKSSSSRLKHMAAGVASGAAAGFVLNPLLLPAGAIAGGFYGNKVYCENAAKEMRIKELGARFDKEGTTCASCGADKSKKGGLGNCYGCGKLFCTSCRDKTFAFTVEEEEFSVQLKVCDSCHEDLQVLKMEATDFGDDGSEPTAPLYDFSTFQAGGGAPSSSAFDAPAQFPAASSAAPVRSVPSYASGLGNVPMYATGGQFHSFTSASPAAASAPSLYPSLEPSAPPEDDRDMEMPVIPDLSAGGGDRLDRVMTAAAFFPDAPDADFGCPSAPAEVGEVSRLPIVQDTATASLTLDTATGPELQIACEQVTAAVEAAPPMPAEEPSAPVAGECAVADPVNDSLKQDWEASWDLPPAVLAQRALEKLKQSQEAEEEAARIAAELPTPAEAVPEAVPTQASAASLFPDAPDHAIAS